MEGPLDKIELLQDVQPDGDFNVPIPSGSVVEVTSYRVLGDNEIVKIKAIGGETAIIVRGIHDRPGYRPASTE